MVYPPNGFTMKPLGYQWANLLIYIVNGAQGRIRTTDTRIFNPLLYQLSYLGIALF